jgi:hypothetical protein
VAWTDLDGVARVAALGTDGRFDDGAVLGPGAVTGLSGGPLLVTEREFPDDGRSEVWASFGGEALRPVSPREQARAGVGAVDPRTGRPVVVFSNRPEPPPGSAAPTVIRTVVQAVERTG